MQLSNIIVSQDYNFNLLNNCLILSNSTSLFKLTINAIFLCFIFTQYKILRKYRNYSININLILLSVLLVSNLIIQSGYFLLAYFLFEILIFLVYKYGSTMNVNKENIFSIEFILISSCASLLFALFYCSLFIINNDIQLKIISACIAVTLLLKIGIFPLFNYSTNSKHQTNIPYCILQFLFIPYIGINLFAKFLQSINFKYAVFQNSILLFLCFCLVSFCVCAYKQKNLIKLLIQAGFGYFSFCLINCLLFLDETNDFCVATSYFFVIFALYSLITILKVSNQDRKINIKFLNNLSSAKPYLANLIIFTFLVLTCIIPNIIFVQNIKILSSLYMIDIFGSLVILTFIISNSLIALASLKIILSCYNPKVNEALNIKKGMILNYIIPMFILLFMIIKIFL